jgi:hypothetical protein
VSELTLRRHSINVLNRLIADSPVDPATLTDDHRRSLSARFRAVASESHRRIDAWMVERAGKPSDAFRWSPATARRVLGNAALRRTLREPTITAFHAVEEEMDDQLLRAVSGYARGGSLAYYLAQSSPSVRALISAEAANWATQLGEAAESLEHPWSVCSSDAYYDVSRARTTLRGRRDLVVERETSRVLLRVRAGAPGKSAGPGLRADLTIDALADADGVAATRIMGLWPEAGVVLSIDGTMEDLRAGARDLVRTAVAQQRHHFVKAA